MKPAVSKPRVTYIPRPDSTSEAEPNALAVVYRYILNCHECKKAAPESRLDDAKGFVNDRAKNEYTPR